MEDRFKDNTTGRAVSLSRPKEINIHLSRVRFQIIAFYSFSLTFVLDMIK